jgi:hypothetical protein
VTVARWLAAILYNGLGRYDEARESARQAADDPSGFYLSTWALPELIEASVRSGNMRVAGDALERLAETTQAGGTGFGLGIEARSRALVAADGAAEGLYREAIDRLGRTQYRLEVARAHLVYGEWLRRQGRRSQAREQLRTAHGMLDTMGADGFAERARRELLATGEMGCPELSGRGSNRIFAGKDGIEWQGRNAVISLRSSRRKPPRWWSRHPALSLRLRVSSG